MNWCLTHLELIIDEDIHRLDVTVGDDDAVQVVYGLNDLTKHIPRLIFRQRACVIQIVEEAVTSRIPK